jgi:bifunctional non-homologous end joining protein LigD
LAALVPKKKSKAGKIPPFIAPQLATLVETPPTGTDWLHEIKYDGYRALASVAGGNIIIRTRNGFDWTDKFRPLVEPIAKLPCDAALLDGEVAVADAEGHTDFGASQDALSRGSGGFGYYVFDLLHLNGDDLRAKPLHERKAKLQKLLGGAGKGPLFFSDHLAGQGEKVFQHACDLKLEGIVSKRAGDPYRSGRTQSWLKSKCGMAQEFVIIGWRDSDKPTRPFSSLLLAVREDGDLRYCGRVGSGYSDIRLDDLAAKFRQHARKTPPVDNIPREIARDAHSLEPVLVAEVAFRGWTRDGLIRQGSFKGLRTDKPAVAIVRERPNKPPKESPMPKARAAKISNDEGDEIEGVHITHPDRVLFAEHGVTKRKLIDYYLRVADLMLPHIVGRRLALVRCPRGSEKECFFQKHASPGWPDQFKHIRIKEKSGTDDYLYIEDERGLVAAAQMGVLELHVWGSHTDRVEQPDRMVFDLDPDEGLTFSKVKDAARDMKDRLQKLGLESFPMATGGKGIHVVVPLARKQDWDQHRNFAEALARLMAEEEPDHYVATMSKAKRRGKIFIDYLRNQRGSTAIAPYSSRARRGAFVAWPVSWRDLAKLNNAHPASVDTVAKLLARSGDPWQSYGRVQQALPAMGKGSNKQSKS